MIRLRDEDNKTIIHIAGWEFIHTIRVRFWRNSTYVENGERMQDYVDLFGIQVGWFSFYWTNPFAGD